jgi:hypothetical protein
LRETSSRLPKTSAGPGWTHSRLWNVCKSSMTPFSPFHRR